MAEDTDPRALVTNEYETAYISELDPNPGAAPSDLLATENKLGGGFKVTVAEVGAVINGITGICDSAANEQHKIVTLPDYDGAVMPREFDVTFTNGNSYGDVTAETPTFPTLSVFNKAGVELCKDIPVGDSRGHNAGAGCWNTGDTMTFRTMSSKICIINSDVRQVLDGYTIKSDGSYIYSKAQTDSTINGALVDYDKLNISGTYTDANDCIPEVRQKKRFLLPYNTSNLPITAGGCVIEATRQFYTDAFYHSVLQVLYQNSTSDNTLIAMYIRNGSSKNGGDTWNWGNWVKFESITKVFNLTTYTYNKVHEYIKDNWNDIPIGKSNYELSTNATGTANYTVCEVTKQSDTFGEVLVHSYYGDLVMLNYNGTWTIEKLVTESELIPKGVSEIFTVNSNFNLTDVKIYSNSNLVNIQRLIITPKNAITTSSIYVIGALSSYKPKQVTRFTAYVNHKCVEGYIETNGNVVIYIESGTSGSIVCDNLMYFY